MSSKQPDTELAIVYPCIYKGKIIGLKYRTLDRRWSQSKQFQTVFYGMDDVDGESTVIIVEGNFLYTCKKLFHPVTGGFSLAAIHSLYSAHCTKSFH